MAQNRVAQVVRVYLRVASLVVLFLAVTAVLYFFLPAAPLEPSAAPPNAPTRGSLLGQRQISANPVSSSSSPSSSILHPSLPLPSSTSSPATNTSESCPLPSSVAASRTPVPTRGPPRVERFRASIVVPLLSLNPSITDNVRRLLAFLNATYAAMPPTSTNLGRRGSSQHEDDANGAVLPVEVLLVVDPARLPILNEETTRQLRHGGPSPLPASSLSRLQPSQQWEVYNFKKLLAEFQYQLRLQDQTYLRLLVLPYSSPPDEPSCHEAGGEAFGSACNLGAARARGQWLFFLSAETYFEEGWFEEQLDLLTTLKSTKAQSSERYDKIGLLGCKILIGSMAERVHSAGLDVALSRRESAGIQQQFPQVVSTLSLTGTATPRQMDSGRKRDRSLGLLDASTLREWQAEQAKFNAQEVRDIMRRDAERQTSIPVKAVGTDIAFPFRRFEGLSRMDERLLQRSPIFAPSSLCFVVSKTVFLSEARGFSAIDPSARNKSTPSSLLRTPFLQVLDLSLRLQREHGRRSFYLPTVNAVVLPKPEGPWNKEDDTTREHHGLCSSTLFPSQPSLSSSAHLASDSVSLLPQPLSTAEFQFAQAWKNEMLNVITLRKQVDVDLIWDSYGGCTGWGLEAVRFITSLEPLLNKVAVVADEKSFCRGLPRHIVQTLRRARSRLDTADLEEFQDTIADHKVTVWMSHKPPVSYPKFPYKGVVSISQRPDYVIGRSMTEATAIPTEWAEASQRVDEIWLPSTFLVDTFASGGIPKEKLLVLPIPIDTHFFSPAPFVQSTTIKRALQPLSLQNRGAYNFLSVFKWETRKGWDILLEAYLKEFKPEDNTTLYLQTYEPATSLGRDKDIMDWKVKQFATTVLKGSSSDAIPRIEVLCQEVPEQDMPRLYAAADAFVLPTRGEGFGMPIMEAMSMALPVIATNWSGPADFINEDNSYPLRVDKLVPAGESSNSMMGAWPGRVSQFAGNWAEPSVEHLRQLMRHVFSNREEARRKGKRAREDIVAKYRETVVAERVVKELKRIERTVHDRRNAGSANLVDPS